MKTPEIVTTIATLRSRIAAWRKEGARVGLVPTMGALHEGHLALVRQTRERCDRIAVSIFVNPAQFAPGEDFDRYPKMLESDLEKLGPTADLVFTPPVSEMYPEGFATRVEVTGPALGLETEFRPQFFAGVATIVTKLLLATLPDMAMFGEKDFQQLLVVRRLVRDLALPIEIAGGLIVREADGLALSSRNVYLNPHERKIAGTLNLMLKDVAGRARSGDCVAEAEAGGLEALLEAGFEAVDYVAVRNAETLAPLRHAREPARVLAAARVGKTRLIDNMAV
ncbi:MAG TPA: pantoate--beta-alanine ligase [Rhizomicrobium sp.]